MWLLISFSVTDKDFLQYLSSNSSYSEKCPKISKNVAKIDFIKVIFSSK